MSHRCWHGGVDPWNPDLERYPQFANATVLQGTVHPGEFLFIPKHWWHTILARGISLSLTHNFGEKLQFKTLLHAVRLSGSHGICTVSKDFVWHGLLGRQFETRLLDDPPFGKMLYDLFSSAVKRRFFAKKQTEAADS